MTTAPAERQNHNAPARSPVDRPRPTVGQAVRRHWLTTALAPLLLVGLAVTIAFQRPDTFTAQARLNAGPVGPSPQTFSGVAEASQALAGTYARVVDAQAVIEPVGAKLAIRPADVAARIEASPIPDSSLILIEAEGPTEREAVELANLTGDSLIRYVTSLTRQNEDSARLLGEFTRTSRSLQALTSRRARMRARAQAVPTAAEQAELGRIEADVEALRLKLRTLSTLYQTSQQGKASASLIQVLSPAAEGESDRIAVLQGMVFLALLAGAASGVALAVWRARRGAQRAAPDRLDEPEQSLSPGPNGGRWRPSARALKVLVTLFVLVLLGGGAAAYYELGMPELPSLGSAERPSARLSPPPHEQPARIGAHPRPRPIEARLRVSPTSAGPPMGATATTAG